ncbi:hypothetical protein ACQ4PT_025422 [Festuca glaucescens]
MASSWSELPHELLGLFAAGLPFPRDRARFGAVCRSWRSALRHHHVQARPLIVNLLQGCCMTPSDGCSHPLPSFPDNTSCIGSTDDWLALRRSDTNGHHNYFLYNPFSKATVQLPVLDTIIHESRKVRKVLVQSTGDDLIVAVMTDSVKCPFIILSHGGNSAWSPGSWDHVYEYIIDIAFLEGKLYAITKDENLFPIDIDLDGEGNLMVSNGRRTIRQPPSYSGYRGWSAYEDEEVGEALLHEEVGWTSDEDRDDNEQGEAMASYEDNNDDNKECEVATSNDDDDDDYDDGHEWEEEPCEEDEDTLQPGFDYAFEDVPHGDKVPVITVRYLIESCGKLLIVRQHMQLLGPAKQFTCRVEVFEAGADTWVPMTNGLGGSQALFVSMLFSKSVHAPCGEIEEDTIYFANTGEVFNMRSQTCSPTRWSIPIPFGTWVFPPDLVV